jgi:hypothetical protein
MVWLKMATNCSRLAGTDTGAAGAWGFCGVDIAGMIGARRSFASRAPIIWRGDAAQRIRRADP